MTFWEPLRLFDGTCFDIRIGIYFFCSSKWINCDNLFQKFLDFRKTRIQKKLDFKIVFTQYISHFFEMLTLLPLRLASVVKLEYRLLGLTICLTESFESIGFLFHTEFKVLMVSTSLSLEVTNTPDRTNFFSNGKESVSKKLSA